MNVVIRGEGIAALCCARLLHNAGIRVRLESTGRATIPALLLGEATQALLRDVFDTPDLLDGAHRIQRRIVAWGPNATPISVAHSAVVISERSLLERIQPIVRLDGSDAAPEWTVFASRPLPEASREYAFGSRRATAIPLALEAGAGPETCAIESLEDGWRFRLPGWVLLVGGARGLMQAEFPAYPRIAWPLCGVGWLACGTAAVGFDPLCGEGTGHAIREAILASAVIRAAAAAAEDPAELLAHYRGRLIAGFRRHLEICREFYLSGGQGAWWQAELASIREGLEWCSPHVQPASAFRYRLTGFELHPLP